eukprot:gene11541-15459_t
MNSNIYDITDLQRQIKLARAYQSKLVETMSQLVEENKVLEIRHSSLSKEAQILGVDDEIRIVGDDDHGVGDIINDIDNSKFKIMNEKLEKSILCQEIRNALPQLESEAEHWENKSKTIQKGSNKILKNLQKLPQQLLQPSEQLEKAIEETLDQRFQKKSVISNDIEGLKKQKNERIKQITALRRVIGQLLEEKVSAVTAYNRVHITYIGEQHRVEVALKEQEAIQHKFERNHLNN